MRRDRESMMLSSYRKCRYTKERYNNEARGEEASISEKHISPMSQVRVQTEYECGVSPLARRLAPGCEKRRLGCCAV
jgi:hypothetical protein